jgi:hypothetical protein
MIRKPGEISGLDQVHAETWRRRGEGNRATDDAVNTFFELRRIDDFTGNLVDLSRHFPLSSPRLRVSA